jgi:hypothetical protein
VRERGGPQQEDITRTETKNNGSGPYGLTS